MSENKGKETEEAKQPKPSQTSGDEGVKDEDLEEVAGGGITLDQSYVADGYSAADFTYTSSVAIKSGDGDARMGIDKLSR